MILKNLTFGQDRNGQIGGNEFLTWGSEQFDHIHCVKKPLSIHSFFVQNKRFGFEWVTRLVETSFNISVCVSASFGKIRSKISFQNQP